MSKSADGGSPLAGEYHLLGKSGDDEKKTIILEPVSCRQKGPKVVWNHFIPSESLSNINFSIFTQTAADKNSAN